MKITAIIPTLNEAVNIEDAIESVNFADEVIVIDSYSTDDTVKLANKHQVKIISRKFDDYSSQKNYAISKAKYNWIYVLDADERITPALRKELLEVAKNPDVFVGFNIYRTFYFVDKKLNYSGWQHDKAIRFFKKDSCKYNGKLVHENIIANGKVGILKNKLKHFSYRSFDHYIEKLNKYAALQAKMLIESNKRITLLHVLIKPPLRFLIQYFIKLGILDGYPGFIISVVHTYGVLVRYIKFWLLKHNMK